jgi:hypothetical protein
MRIDVRSVLAEIRASSFIIKHEKEILYFQLDSTHSMANMSELLEARAFYG